MPAEFTTGFFVREPAWHGQGLVLDTYPESWDEAAKLAGLDWEPVKEPTYERHLVGMDGDQPAYEYKVVEGHEIIRHGGTGAILDVAMSSYELIPNAVMGELTDALIGNGARFNTGGQLYGGRKVWVLAEIDNPIRVKGDPSETLQYLALLNAHDGTSALQAIPTNVRVVCANTWHAAEVDGSRTGHSYTFKHTKNWRERLDEAKEVILFGRKKSRLLMEELNALVDIKVTPRQREIFVQEFVPMPVAQIISDRVVANVEATRKAIRDILASVTCEGIDNTVYGLVQAAGEYLDHERRAKSYSSYVNRTLLTVEPLKHRAKKIALAAANA